MSQNKFNAGARSPIASKPTINKAAHNQLMSILTEANETPTSAHGVFIANSTIRDIKAKINNLFDIV